MVGITVAVKVAVDLGVTLTAGGGDLAVVAIKSGPSDKTSYTLIGGGVLSEPSEGKESFGTVVSTDKDQNLPTKEAAHNEQSS